MFRRSTVFARCGGLLLVLMALNVVSQAQESSRKPEPAANPSPAITNSPKTPADSAGGGAGTDSDPDTDTPTEVDRRARKIVEDPFPERVKAPEGILDGGAGWLNSAGPISLRDLRGKIVLIDFWTYCCINCMHVLPDLTFLEQKYPNQLVVIGVHSAKFDNEKDSENIRQAIMRYEIEHPVVNDNRMIIWSKFRIRAWPTLALIGPEGNYIGSQSGEGNRELFDAVIAKLIAYHRANGTLDESPVSFRLERHRLKPAPLRYPGKVLADAAGKRLFIADTNHNRIVITSLDGRLMEVVGNGAIGLRNGSYQEARFDHPQGMELVGETLYVADTENHCLRAIDLTGKTVSTLAGTGLQSRIRVSQGPRETTPLNSPWALKHLDENLYIAMAGSHQIWVHQTGSDTISVYAGSGREDIVNGPLSAAALAQPSGITNNGTDLFVVDSEGSAVRRIGTGDGAAVTTIVGTSELPHGQSLFAFGDRDGRADEVRLQHPLGIAWHDGTLYVADSYNHKIRRVDVELQEAQTWIGDGKPGDQLDPPRLSEPGGVSIADRRLYIADTNNHRICVADLATGELSVLAVDGLVPPTPPKDDNVAAEESTARVVDEQAVKSAETLAFEIELTLPEGYKLNALAPVTWKLTARDAQKLLANDFLDTRDEAAVKGNLATFEVPLVEKTGRGVFDVQVSYGYCRDLQGRDGGLCRLRSEHWRVPIVVSNDTSQKSIRLAVREKP